MIALAQCFYTPSVGRGLTFKAAESGNIQPSSWCQLKIDCIVVREGDDLAEVSLGKSAASRTPTQHCSIFIFSRRTYASSPSWPGPCSAPVRLREITIWKCHSVSSHNNSSNEGLYEISVKCLQKKKKQDDNLDLHSKVEPFSVLNIKIKLNTPVNGNSPSPLCLLKIFFFNFIIIYSSSHHPSSIENWLRFVLCTFYWQLQNTLLT